MSIMSVGSHGNHTHLTVNHSSIAQSAVAFGAWAPKIWPPTRPPLFLVLDDQYRGRKPGLNAGPTHSAKHENSRKWDQAEAHRKQINNDDLVPTSSRPD